jgi:2-polyprenyl-3-methyl-5-hydroxy-6-metoxy-1,4-benzoquinol methylase
MENVFVDINCPVCDGKRFKTIWQSTPREFLSDFRKSYYNLKVLGIDLDTKFYIKKCRNCSFVCVNPQFRSDLYNVVYNEAKIGQVDKKRWAFQEGDLKHLYNTYHKWSNAKNLMRVLSYLRKRFKKPKNENYQQITLLDYGCGFGHLLELSKVFEVEAVGVDIDEHRLGYCKNKGLNVCRPEELDAGNKFDIVISISVIEHVHDLNQYFKYIRDRLKVGGYFHVGGLNPKVIRKEKRRGIYKNVMPFEHINYFTPRSFDVMSEKYGLKRIKIGNIIQEVCSPIDYITPFLKNVVFRGFYPDGGFMVDMIKVRD